MQSEIDETNSLKQYISELKAENVELKGQHRENFRSAKLRQSAKIADRRFFLLNFNKNLRSSAKLIRHIFLI